MQEFYVFDCLSELQTAWPDIRKQEEVLFECVDSAMGLSCEIPLDLLLMAPGRIGISSSEPLMESENIFRQIVDKEDGLEEIIRVCDVRSANACLYHEISEGKVLCIIQGN